MYTVRQMLQKSEIEDESKLCSSSTGVPAQLLGSPGFHIPLGEWELKRSLCLHCVQPNTRHSQQFIQKRYVLWFTLGEVHTVFIKIGMLFGLGEKKVSSKIKAAMCGGTHL